MKKSKRSKRMVSLILSFVMIASMFSFACYAETEETKYWVIVGEYPTDGSGGTISGEGEYAPGEEVTISVKPSLNNGYCSAQWVCIDIGLSHTAAHLGKTSHTFTMPEYDVQISISFAEHGFDIVSRDLEDGTHDGVCLQCGELEGNPVAHADNLGAGDSKEPDGYCDDCGADMHTHDYSIVEYNKTYHWYECECGEKDNITKAAHEYVDGICSVCEYENPISTDEKDDEEEHTHSYSSVWLMDASHHWRDCSCGDMKDKTAHTPGPAATATTPQTCTVCGYEIAPATGYTLTINYDVTSSGVTVGSGNETVTGIAVDTVVDLSKHWPDLTATGSDGKTYYFAGFTKKGEIAVINSVTVTGDVELEAAWTTEEQITVDLNPNDGILPYARTRENYDESIYWMNREHKPVRAGYDFAGWSLADDGTADSGDTLITADCTLYAVWQQYLPSYDDDYYDPPPASIPVDVGGDYDAILRDDVVIIRGDAPISGTLDLTEINAKAIQLPADALEASTEESHAVTIRFPDDTAATLTGSGLAAASDALRSGESLQIAVKNAGSEVLPKTLTEQGPYGGSEAAIDKSIFKATGIENIEDRLKTLGLINGNTDSSVTEDEFEYLYHYLTTGELMALKNELNESAHFEHHHNAVNWLTKMIERDNTALPFTYNNLLDYADFTDEQIAALTRPGGINGSDYPTLGELRELGLTLEQMQLLQGNAKALREDETSAEVQAKYDALLAWLDDAIAHKELEALYAQMDEWIAEADAIGAGAYVAGNPIEEVKQAVKTMTTAELEKFLEKANEAKNYSVSMELYDLAAFLSDELEAREASDTPTYVQVGGTSDGINPIFIGAVDVNIGAVKADGTTTPIAIKADRSDAVAWSTNIGSAALEEMLAMLGTATTEDVVSNIKAYKVLDNGTLEARASKVTVNADGTLTLSAMSDGNSTYVFLYEPAKADVDKTPTSPNTGESFNVRLWFNLMLASGFALAGTWVYRIKRKAI